MQTLTQTTRVLALAVALLAGAAPMLAQDFTVFCPPGDTLACIEDLPEPDPSSVDVTTDCDVDFDGNPHTPGQGTTTGGDHGGRGDDGGGDSGSDDGVGDDDGASTAASCDTVAVDCYALTAAALTRDTAAGETTVTVEIAYAEARGCKHAVSHVAFSLPDGVVASAPGNGTGYNGLLGRYYVENPTNNPFYSIKFESLYDAFEPGTTERFTWTVPGAGAYADGTVEVSIKAARNVSTATLTIDCGAEGTASDTTTTTEPPATDTTASDPTGAPNYQVTWLEDYILPGGTTCDGPATLIERTYSVTDACAATNFCFQSFIVPVRCENGAPVSCEPDSTAQRTAVTSRLVVSEEPGETAVQFEAVAADLGQADGFYSVTWRSGATKGAARGGALREVGRVAGRAQPTYAFSHEVLALGDEVRVAWVAVGRGTNQGQDAVSGAAELGTAAAGLSVYPNPGRRDLTVELDAGRSGAAEVIVTDAAGREVARRVVAADGATRERFAASSWATGLYFVRVERRGAVVATARWVRR